MFCIYLEIKYYKSAKKQIFGVSLFFNSKKIGTSRQNFQGNFNPKNMNTPKFNVCMVCDFFYPRLGGVEMHIFQLALCIFPSKIPFLTFPRFNRKRTQGDNSDPCLR